MRLRIRPPEAVLARVATNAQHPVLTESAHEFDELLVIAREKFGITELCRFIAQSREVRSYVTPGRLADRHCHGQRSRLCK